MRLHDSKSSVLIGATEIHVVLFDAVGTLIRPDPPVSDVYYEIGRRFGSNLSHADIRSRFSKSFAKYETSGVYSDRDHLRSSDVHATNQQMEIQRWQLIVRDIFTDVADAEESLFLALWEHFAQSCNWSLYDDVKPTWSELTSRGLTIGIASNFDDRLESICAEFEPLSHCRHVFWSARIGFSKPSQGFFSAIERQLAMHANRILLVGDHANNDYAGANKAGWHAILLDRNSLQPADHTINRLTTLSTLLSTF